jgi:hypothetical protein
MPKIISFAWTSTALVAGRKTVTRRQWTPSYAAQFHRNDLVDAYDRQPRYRGRKIATIRLTHDPVYLPDATMPETDYEAEGFAFLDEHPEFIPKSWKKEMDEGETLKDHFEYWRQSGESSWVIRFIVISIEGNENARIAV